ncbi:MAG: hypothetical protein KY439_00190 [Actinobacteria bacterium]|nr:hypothetical protein [Actinomycetota bacterium]
MRKVAWLAGVATLLATGGYIFVYLYRWEWHRALIVAALFLAAEVAIATALVHRRLGKLERRLDDGQGRREDPGRAVDPQVMERLRASTPRRNHFAWLEPRAGQASVFIPVLLGSGVVVSALAWVLERVAGHTAEPAMERGLARHLSALAFPADGLVADDAELLAQDGGSRHDEDLVLLLGPSAER